MQHTLTLIIAMLLLSQVAFPAGNLIRDAEMAGYLFGPAEKVPEAFNGGYHCRGCAKTFALMGQAFAAANHKLLEALRR